MSEVVTGEAVVVEVRIAQLPSRVAALLIDILVQLVTLAGASFAAGALLLVSDPALTAMVYITLSVLVLVGYPVVFETLSRGRSLGKLALGLRVVSDDGGPERFRQALFRGLAGVLEIWTLSGAPALISSLISEKGKRLGDVFAGTIVIAERAPRRYGPPLEMPPPLASWAATLELSRLPEEVASTAVRYLTRRNDLSPAVQHEMGARIAAEMSAFVSPPPPPGVPPFAYLTAVLAERRRRDQARLSGRGGAPGHPPYAAPFPAAYPPAAYPPPSAQPPAAYPPAGRPPAAPYGPPTAAPYGRPPAVRDRPPAPPQGGPASGTTPGGFVPPA